MKGIEGKILTRSGRDFFVGKKFKRDKYGLSDWTDTIQEVWSWYSKDPPHSIHFFVKGKLHNYPIEEVVILD
jgi:hypothetical protein